MGGLGPAWDYTFLPDGRILLSESIALNTAAIRVIQNDTLLATNAWQTTLCDQGEQGLLGMTPDPNFNSNGYIYIYYTARTATSPTVQCTGRISRLTMTGNTLGSEDIIMSNIRTDYGSFHQGGDLRFGNDGYLYLTTGNVDQTSLSQLLNNMTGKVIRILPDNSVLGYSTVGNPYHSAQDARHCGQTPTGPGPCREIAASGLRNPFSMTVQPNMGPGIPGTGNLWIGDVGADTTEELNVLPLPPASGIDFGYPTCEGPCGTPGITQPIYSYPHPQVNGAAIIGGAFYTLGVYPAEYRNNYYFADYVAGYIRRLAYVSGSWQLQTPDFATAVSSQYGIIGIQAGPDGALYYLFSPGSWTGNASSELRRIEYGQNSNLAPEARVSAAVLNCPLNAACTFDASASTDPNNDPITRYDWEIQYVGDPGPIDTFSQASPILNYSFAEARNATVRVRAIDEALLESQPATLTVFPGNQPATGDIDLDNLTAPARSLYYAGDRWAFAPINLNDPDGWGTTAPNNAITWSIVFHHNDHSHPFQPLITTRTGQFTISTIYHEDYRLWYRVLLYLRDARGYVTTIQRDIDPAVVNVSFAASPLPANLTVDGLTFNTPNTTPFVVGTRFTLAAPTSLTSEGLTYTFLNWSDATVRVRTVTIPPTDVTYTANYNFPASAAPVRNRFISTDANLTLTWLAVSGATGYEVQISTNSTFSALVSVPGNPYAGETLTMPMLSPGVYYWRVRALRAAPAAPGAWSTAETFSVSAP
ncbi:MAG TPA: PQQ-dependent sugar dehydrogenase [Aggregatilineales bacterium]|nr:PQQ-dependent sugar dehydrogenase [Aggregatilineales bacterium]